MVSGRQRTQNKLDSKSDDWLKNYLNPNSYSTEFSRFPIQHGKCEFQTRNRAKTLKNINAKVLPPPFKSKLKLEPFGPPLNLVGFSIENINVVSLYPTPFSKWGETCSSLTKTKRNIVIGLFSGCIILYIKPSKMYRGVPGNYGHPVCMDKSRKRKEGYPVLKENQNVKA